MASDPDDTILPAGGAGSTGGEEQPGDRIGPYKLVLVIGEGSFGTVWLAERREPMVQRVALKLIKAGMDSKAVIARFEQERQALAVMNHPGIAQVVDGGLTPRGRPYFAMEFVKGEPITQFCDARRLPVRDRLALFAQVCDAVQHAHLKGIVHRDLTPNNILALDVEGESPRVKVVDFGVAKAMGQPLTEKTIFTETGQMIGTPAYMSPEQADPSLSDIDTRSDVYSLGVLLYELVAGSTPFDGKTLRSKAYAEMQRIIREEDPPTPSTRLSTISTKDAELASRIEKSRGTRLRELAHELRSELEWIPLKAMRKEPQNRYQTALDLRRDVESYLEGKPVSAGPDSVAYRLRKWVRRHRTAVRAAALVLVAVGLGFGYRPAVEALQEWREWERMHAVEVIAHDPDPAVVTDADARERMRKAGLPWKIRHTASGIVMLLVPPGEFMMGSPEDEPGHENDETQHQRTISGAFYLSMREVSNAEWRAVVGRDAETPWDGNDLPVSNVSWNMVNDLFIPAARNFFRLPTEAEWEYACRAGTTTAFSFGDTISLKQVRFGARNLQRERPVECGSLPANPWGFCEMHGNVWEWVNDRYEPYPIGGGITDPEARWASTRVFRGGSWAFESDLMRSSTRLYGSPGDANSSIGFRVARTP
jgi:formylglycine-generating enzyme required for sulfatase activity/serine/threonine protein kinase